MREKLRQMAGWSRDAWGAAAFAALTSVPALYALSNLHWPK